MVLYRHPTSLNHPCRRSQRQSAAGSAAGHAQAAPGPAANLWPPSSFLLLRVGRRCDDDAAASARMAARRTSQLHATTSRSAVLRMDLLLLDMRHCICSNIRGFVFAHAIPALILTLPEARCKWCCSPAASASQAGAPADAASQASEARVRRLLALVQLRKLYRNLIRGQCLLELPTPVYSQAGG